MKSNEEILKQLDQVHQREFGQNLNRVRNKRKCGTNEHNKAKKSIFFQIECWSKWNLRHNLDVMYIKKNIRDSILGTLLNINHKTKDTYKARLDLQDTGIRHELHLEERDANVYKSSVIFNDTSREAEFFLICEDN